MDFYRKILILFIVLIFIYIIFRLIIKRIQIKEEILEGYENDNVNSIQYNYDCGLTIQNDLAFRLKNLKDNSINYFPDAFYLRNYAIKSSMNSGYNGKENTMDMINYVLTRGCRFLDFEVYKEDVYGVVIVSVSKNADNDFIPLDNTLSLSETLQYINVYAFNSICPNYGDPMFIQLRPKIRNTEFYETNKKSICENITKSINENLTPKYTEKVTSETPIVNLLGKFIIVMDDASFPDCSSVSNLSPTTISYGTLTTQKEYELLLKTDKYSCDVYSINQILIEDASYVAYKSNVSANILYTNYSAQIVPMMFWDTGGDLCSYETLFNKCGGGVVPLSFIYNQLKNNSSSYISYPDPLFASAIYGNQTTTIIVIVSCLVIVGFIIIREIS